MPRRQIQGTIGKRVQTNPLQNKHTPLSWWVRVCVCVCVCCHRQQRAHSPSETKAFSTCRDAGLWSTLTAADHPPPPPPPTPSQHTHAHTPQALANCLPNPLGHATDMQVKHVGSNDSRRTHCQVSRFCTFAVASSVSLSEKDGSDWLVWWSSLNTHTITHQPRLSVPCCCSGAFKPQPIVWPDYQSQTFLLVTRPNQMLTHWIQVPRSPVLVACLRPCLCVLHVDHRVQ